MTSTVLQTKWKICHFPSRMSNANIQHPFVCLIWNLYGPMLSCRLNIRFCWKLKTSFQREVKCFSKDLMRFIFQDPSEEMWTNVLKFSSWQQLFFLLWVLHCGTNVHKPNLQILCGQNSLTLWIFLILSLFCHDSHTQTKTTVQHQSEVWDFPRQRCLHTACSVQRFWWCYLTHHVHVAFWKSALNPVNTSLSPTDFFSFFLIIFIYVTLTEAADPSERRAPNESRVGATCRQSEVSVTVRRRLLHRAAGQNQSS